MSENCFGKKCIECEDHALQSGKVVCNLNNRLGLRKVKVDDFLETK